MDASVVASPVARIDRLLQVELVVWLSSIRPDGGPHLVPVWFSWDGEALLVASKPRAQKVRNMRANPQVMLAVGEAEDDFDVGLIEARAELLDVPAADVLPASHLDKYDRQMAAIGLGRDEFLATYSQVVRIVPTRFLPWHGRSTPASAGLAAASSWARLNAWLGRVRRSFLDGLRPRQALGGAGA
jgi:PPOX class probable F420-dependent enzyme